MSSSSHHLEFSSRRSPVYSTGGMVACTQPLASQAGYDILSKGGNAVDACVAMAAVLAVTEPTSTGIGGDMFLLYFDGKTKKVSALNGSGRSAQNSSLEQVVQRNGDTIGLDSIDAVTIPGALKGWGDAVKLFGKLSLEQVLEPALKFARDGFPVSPVASAMWNDAASRLINNSLGQEYKEWLVQNDNKWQAPKPGQIIKLPTFAKTLSLVSQPGQLDSPHTPLMKPILETLSTRKSSLTFQDFANHTSQVGSSLTLDYHHWRIHQHGPNGQGITVLIALAIIKHLQDTNVIPNLSSYHPTSPEYLHIQIEALKIAFADSEFWTTDPDHVDEEIYRQLLSADHIAKRAKLFQPLLTSHWSTHGTGIFPAQPSDTVYLCAVDSQGNSCSFINSLYKPFGSAIIVPETGIILHNRGCNFSLKPSHPNIFAPSKRPFHTILPGMITHKETGKLLCTYGNMGGFMQPQGQLQLLLRLFHHPDPFIPQSTVDAPRFMIAFDESIENLVYVEAGFPTETLNTLESMGHRIKVVTSWQREKFGRAQVILSDECLIGASDPRGDGHALPTP